MNAKKLIAGILAGTMVLGTASVTTFAAKPDPNYVAKMKPMPENQTETTLTSADGKESFKSTWWDPQTFSNSLKVTENKVTVTLTCKTNYPDSPPKQANGEYFYVGDQAPFVFVYSSDTGAIYGGNPTGDESYTVGVKNHMVEYCGIRGDGHIYSEGGWDTKNAAWDGSTLTTGTLTAGITATGTCGWGSDNQPIYDDWIYNNNKGYTATITAVLEGDNAVITYNYSPTGPNMIVTVPVSKTKNSTYICLASGNGQKDETHPEGGTLSNIKYKYSSVSANDITVTYNKTEFAYNGKQQMPKPTVKFKGATLKSGTDYDVKVTSGATASKKVGEYTLTVTFKGNYADYGTRTQVYKIVKAKQTLKLAKTSVSLKAKTVKKKAKTYKMYVKGNSTGLAVNSSNKKAVTVKKAKKSSKKGYTQYNITVKKGTKKGTYKITMYAKSNANYLQSSSKTFKVKVTK